MVFSSLPFLFIFLPIFMIIYYFIREPYRNCLLFLGSLIFYAVGEPTYLFLMLFSILFNFIMGIGIEKNAKKKLQKKILLIFTLCIDFSFLIFFKYTNFLIENIISISSIIEKPVSISFLELSLPLGISFYTFQIVSYIIDIYRGKIRANHSFIDLGTYISMFPQLIAGPIVMYADIETSLKYRTITMEKIDEGLKYFIWGLGYKVILANRIGMLWNEINTIGFISISTPLAWIGALAFSLQLYFDFCGYSLMAIGLGKMLGFHIPQNFDHPYMARSVTDFWRKWHITLGAWFKEYVYIPLGGNKRGKCRLFLNLFLIWLLVGLWHGAAWNFIIWGLFILFFQILEKTFLLKFLGKNHWLSKLLSHLYMAGYILISWIIFAISDLEQLGIYLCRMFPFLENIFMQNVTHTINEIDYLLQLQTYGPILLLGIVFCTTFPNIVIQKLNHRNIWNFISIGTAFGIFWYAVYFLSIGVNNPFLYFRF